MSKKTLSDRETIDFRNGDEYILQRLFDAYYQQLYLYCYKILKNRLDAEDVVAEVMVKLWSQRKSIKNDNHIYNFLHMTARNKCIDLLRQRKTGVIQSLEAAPEEHPSAEWDNNIYDRLEAGIKAGYLSALLSEMNKLPAQQKEVMHLHVICEVPVKKIATQLRLSIKTVYFHKKQAIQHLKQLLGLCNDDNLAPKN
jgi:RNA polymerase sigma-70 factor (ECF subfamily)